MMATSTQAPLGRSRGRGNYQLPPRVRPGYETYTPAGRGGGRGLAPPQPSEDGARRCQDASVVARALRGSSTDPRGQTTQPTLRSAVGGGATQTTFQNGGEGGATQPTSKNSGSFAASGSNGGLTKAVGSVSASNAAPAPNCSAAANGYVTSFASNDVSLRPERNAVATANGNVTSFASSDVSLRPERNAVATANVNVTSFGSSDVSMRPGRNAVKDSTATSREVSSKARCVTAVGSNLTVTALGDNSTADPYPPPSSGQASSPRPGGLTHGSPSAAAATSGQPISPRPGSSSGSSGGEERLSAYPTPPQTPPRSWWVAGTPPATPPSLNSVASVWGKLRNPEPDSASSRVTSPSPEQSRVALQSTGSGQASSQSSCAGNSMGRTWSSSVIPAEVPSPNGSRASRVVEGQSNSHQAIKCHSASITASPIPLKPIQQHASGSQTSGRSSSAPLTSQQQLQRYAQQHENGSENSRHPASTLPSPSQSQQVKNVAKTVKDSNGKMAREKSGIEHYGCFCAPNNTSGISFGTISSIDRSAPVVNTVPNAVPNTAQNGTLAVSPNQFQQPQHVSCGEQLPRRVPTEGTFPPQSSDKNSPSDPTLDNASRPGVVPAQYTETFSLSAGNGVLPSETGVVPDSSSAGGAVVETPTKQSRRMSRPSSATSLRSEEGRGPAAGSPKRAALEAETALTSPRSSSSLVSDCSAEEAELEGLDHLPDRVLMYNKRDPVSVLMEYGQTREVKVSFTEVTRSGPHHASRFHTAAIVDGETYPPSTGTSKKTAKKAAAIVALRAMYDRGMAHLGHANVTVNQELKELKENGLATHEHLSHSGKVMYASRRLLELAEETQFINYSKDKVLAAVVLERRGRYNVAGLGTGNRVIQYQHLATDGSRLIHSHAEVIARRAFIRYLLKELAAYRPSEKHHLFTTNKQTGMLKLHDEIKVHLYISRPPCGDAAAFPTITNFPNRMRAIRKQGQLRTIIDDGEGAIPTDFSLPANPNGKERLRVMTCSDKILRWNAVGVQGGLLSNFLDPIYLHSVVIGSHTGDQRGHVPRAISGRLKCGRLHEVLNKPYRIVSPEISYPILPDNYAINKSKQYCITWTEGDPDAEVIDAVTGSVAMEPTDDSPSSRICKRALLALFRKACLNLGARQLATLTYAQAKQSAKAFQRTKTSVYDHLLTCGFGQWISIQALYATDDFAQAEPERE